MRILFLLLVFAFFGIILFHASKEAPRTYYVLGLNLILIASLQLKRRDKLFLQTHFHHFRIIYLAEYVLLSFPVIICFFYHSQWMMLVILLIGIAASCYLELNFSKRTLNSRFQRWIPDESFEWKAGLRKWLYLLVPLWIVSLSTSFFIGTAPIAIFIFGFLPLGFYDKGESIQMILAYEKGTNHFLGMKIRLQFIIFSVLVVPLIILFILFHPGLWYIPVIEYFIFVSFHIYLLLAKYAFYISNEKSSAFQMFGSLGFIAVVLPILVPVMWVLTIKFYYQSFEKLNFYLHDFN